MPAGAQAPRRDTHTGQVERLRSDEVDLLTFDAFVTEYVLWTVNQMLQSSSHILTVRLISGGCTSADDMPVVISTTAALIQDTQVGRGVKRMVRGGAVGTWALA